MHSFVRTQQSAFTTAPRRLEAPLPSHSVKSVDLGCWEKIYDPEINLAVCARSPSTELAQFSRSACRHEFGLTLVLNDTRTLDNHISKSVRNLPGYAAWLEDIAYLIDAFKCLLDTQTVGLRLCTLASAMCPRFHVDNNQVRMIATYGAQGTEWLANTDVNRNLLGPRVVQSDRGAGPYQGEATIRRLPAFSAALLKGEKWEGNVGRGLVHRSPAIQQPQRRLLLTLDIVN